MNTKFLSLLSAILFATSASAQSEMAPGVGVDLIIKNARIWVDNSHDGKKWAEALSVKDGIIHSIGSSKEIEKEKGPSTKIIDVKGKLVTASFNDAHAHILTAGLNLSRLNLASSKSLDAFKKAIKEYAEKNPMKRWIFGFGWDHTGWPVQKYPSRQDIDSVVADRPVMLWHTDEHYLVVNSKGLEILKIGKTTEDANVLKDKDGEPTGILLEKAAEDAAHKVDVTTVEELRQALLDGQAEALKNGVTSIQGQPSPENLDNLVKILTEFYQTKKLKLRYSVWCHIENIEKCSELKAKLKNDKIPEDWVKITTAKGFLDGVISSYTAALLEPYSDKKTELGTPMFTQDKLNEFVLKANKAGFAVALHAIGDRSVAMALNAFSSSKKQLFNSKLRNRIEHIELMAPHLYKQFHDLGVVASMQPSHMTYDKESENYNDARLGSKRVQNAFAWKGFLQNKIPLSFGTDWPIMPVNPFVGLFAATTRQHFNGKPPRGWIPSQKISMEQAVEAYTLGSAYAEHEDHLKGSIREGKFADLVVYEKDVFKQHGLEVMKNGFSNVIVNGEVQ